MVNEKNSLIAMRHSTEHVLTQAMLKLFTKVKMAMGPATDEGFYFDFDYDGKITENDFEKIENEMHTIANKNLPIKQKIISVNEAKKIFAGNEYKLEWISDIEKRGEKVSTYETGDEFVDLCAGPHVPSTGKIGFFKLLSVAGAYWHGDEKNKMLTRIYGTSFSTKKELEEYLKNQQEAKESDHRTIGKNLNLFVFSDLVGKGLPLLTDKGATIKRELERFIVDEEIKRGYKHVVTPHLAKTDLYKTSGHYPYYKDTMYPLMKVDEEELILRPMTCPHHFMIYSSQLRSYKELPLRIAEIASQFRYEKSGELTGLVRIRTFTLNDAHIFVEPEKVKEEIKNVLDLIDYANGVLGLERGKDYRFRLSLGNKDDDKKYYKDDNAWDNAEKALKEVLIETKAPFYEARGEAAFYGPKIDVQVKKINGKEETAFTVQYDFVMPKRFDLKYIDAQGQVKQPIVIHRAAIGCLERTIAFLIEKFKGNFPTWLSPVQVKVLPISKRHITYANEVTTKLRNERIRVEIDERNATLPGKIRDAQMEKVSYMVVVGDKELKNNTITVRARSEKDYGECKIEEFIKNIQTEIDKKIIN